MEPPNKAREIQPWTSEIASTGSKYAIDLSRQSSFDYVIVPIIPGKECEL
jgi:hypothetical protein